MAYVNTHRVARNGLVERLVATKDSVLSALTRRRLFNTTVHELSTLSDRELADLGISRFDIRAIAREAAYGN